MVFQKWAAKALRPPGTGFGESWLLAPVPDGGCAGFVQAQRPAAEARECL